MLTGASETSTFPAAFCSSISSFDVSDVNTPVPWL
jgi:hypothetical protein